MTTSSTPISPEWTDGREHPLARRSPSSRGWSRDRLQLLLGPAGVTLDGPEPHDIQVRDPRFFAAARRGALGLGESYVEGWWECPRLDELAHRLLGAGLDRTGRWRPGEAFRRLAARLSPGTSRRRAFAIGRRHYDLGNDLFVAMLDRRMNYSCASWRDARSLDEAQEAKLDLVCRKVGLRPGMRVLDVGCGWGGFARFAAERHGASVVGVTVSREQATFARGYVSGLPVEIVLADYRSLEGRFDAVVSIGMFEHVGRRHHRLFLEKVRSLLAEDGLFLLHTIGRNLSAVCTDPWIDRYVFPGSLIPSLAQVARAAEGLFVVEDVHGFGPDYDRTLLAWNANVEAHRRELAGRYDDRFFRLWRYYLLTCAGSFRARRNQLWQVVLSPRGVPGGYVAPR